MFMLIGTRAYNLKRIMRLEVLQERNNMIQVGIFESNNSVETPKTEWYKGSLEDLIRDMNKTVNAKTVYLHK